MNKNLMAAIAAVAHLNRDELQTLNSVIGDRFKKLQLEAGFEFKIGDKAQFESKRGITVFIKITGFNRARTAVKGTEINADGSARTNFPMKWTVANSLLKKVA